MPHDPNLVGARVRHLRVAPWAPFSLESRRIVRSPLLAFRPRSMRRRNDENHLERTIQAGKCTRLAERHRAGSCDTAPTRAGFPSFAAHAVRRLTGLGSARQRSCIRPERLKPPGNRCRVSGVSQSALQGRRSDSFQTRDRHSIIRLPHQRCRRLRRCRSLADRAHRQWHGRVGQRYLSRLLRTPSIPDRDVPARLDGPGNL
jgi:hypothetical protein